MQGLNKGGLASVRDVFPSSLITTLWAMPDIPGKPRLGLLHLLLDLMNGALRAKGSSTGSRVKFITIISGEVMSANGLVGPKMTRMGLASLQIMPLDSTLKWGKTLVRCDTQAETCAPKVSHPHK